MDKVNNFQVFAELVILSRKYQRKRNTKGRCLDGLMIKKDPNNDFYIFYILQQFQVKMNHAV